MARKTLIDGHKPLDEDESSAAPTDPVLAVVDEALLAFAGRSLVTGDEAIDRLLDLRNALVAATTLRDLEAGELVGS